MSEPIHVLSLGAGVQSSCMALMAAKGEITPMPDAAIFADTGAEPQGVYDWLSWLEKELPFPVHRIMYKDGLLENLKRGTTGLRHAAIPFFTDGTNGSYATLGRNCTAEYKVRPIIRKVRELAGLKKGQRAPKHVAVIQWIGISWDEIQRMKESGEAWIEHRWPLIDLRMERRHCLDWMRENGYPKPPRSACFFCPYHSNKEWRRLRDEEPAEFAKAVDLDKRIRTTLRGVDGDAYMHRSRAPLDEVDLSTDVERGQRVLDLFQNDCEGMCGV